LVDGLQAIPGVRIYGITEEDRYGERTPTVAFRREGFSPAEIAQALGEQNIAVWDGHYYALEVVQRLGLLEKGGMVRVGIVHYNTLAEVEALLEVVSGL
jgi:selenocysteine lyase/cysteine desulfurase